ncbi:MAG: sodium:solute symporter family protein [Thermoanaerobaculia bacterium]
MVRLAVLLYSLAAIALGWRASRRAEDPGEFWTAGRSLGGGSVGLSMSAGFMSVSWSCVYAVQLFYWYGLGAVWLITIPWVLSLGGIYLLARRYHALPSFSQPEMVGARFGRGARVSVAISLAVVFLVWGGAEIYVAARLLASPLGLAIPTTVVGISLVVAIYSSLGGFRAVVDTDRMQYVIVVLYIVAMGILAVRGLHAAGAPLIPPASVHAAKSGTGWTSLFSPGVAIIILTFVAYLPGWLFETDLWLRVQAARSDRDARRGVLIAGLNSIAFVGILPLFIGIAALVLFPLHNGSIPASIGQEGDAIFAALVTRYAPAWLEMLVAAGLVAAAMSTIDTCANVMGLAIAYDLLEVQKNAASSRTSRWVTIGVMAAACVFALNTESLWSIFYLSGGILTTAVAFPVAAVFAPEVSAAGVRWSSITGFVATFAAYFAESRGWLGVIEPASVRTSGLGYILVAAIAAALAYGAAVVVESRARRRGSRTGDRGSRIEDRGSRNGD